ncbi:MAG: UPF0149 family protein [Rubrivivax sp.]|jgi:uncharacterized protein|nr:UPF0149 family protein [Rubrivivax sp.]
MPLVPRQNTDAEVDAFASLCQRLGGFDVRVSAEWADGFLTAVHAGWRAVPFDEALEAMCGDAFDRACADPEDRDRALAVLRARDAVLADHLDPEWLLEAPDSLRLVPLMSPWDDEARDEAVLRGWVTPERRGELATGAVWAEGFLDALDAFAADWSLPPDADAEAFGDLLAQVRALTFDEGSAELQAHVEQTYGEERADRERLIDEACFAVQDLRLWWLDHAPRPGTRRVAKTPGRNDPCPCGSGLKFKKCHGAG